MPPPFRVAVVTACCAAVGVGDASSRSLSIASTVPTQYCVLNNGVSTPYTFNVDPTTNYIYLPLATVAPTNFANISQVFAAIGSGTYGPGIANVRSVEVRWGSARGSDSKLLSLSASFSGLRRADCFHRRLGNIHGVHRDSIPEGSSVDERPPIIHARIR